MTSLVGISGSLRRGSFNSLLLQAAARQLPQAVSNLKDRIAAADGLVLAMPEYNNGIPGVFKNAIDWATRPPADVKRVFGAKPIALMGALPGGFGTILSQSAWLPILRTLGTEPLVWRPAITVAC
jgi:NAD(P)H-dependent FMN reductase